MTTLRGVHYSRVSDPSQVSGASLDQQVAHGVEQTIPGSNPLRDWFEKAAAVVQAVLAPPQVAWGRA